MGPRGAQAHRPQGHGALVHGPQGGPGPGLKDPGPHGGPHGGAPKAGANGLLYELYIDFYKM